MTNLPYDYTSKDSILNYAQHLLGKSLRDLHPDAIEYSSGKGRMGQSVEKYHFQYEPNCDAEPDFAEAGVELKCTPLKTNADGSMVSKERLVLNIIDYVAEANATFYTSSFWHKNQLLLLMFYLHEQGVNVVDLIFKIIRLWNFPDVDKKIIKDDWEKLHWKMAHGLAHEISEGDTLYLGACPKGSRAGAELREQIVPGSPLAQQRAYSIKSKYLNTIILESLLHPEMHDNVYLSTKQIEKIKASIDESASIVNSLEEYEEGETFEELIERRFSPYYGKTIYEIEQMTGKKVSSSPKAISNSVIHIILNVDTPKIKEFEKANIQQKSIRLEPNGKLKESMVFDQIKYTEIVKEKVWEDSVWYNTLTQRFLFIVFRKDQSNDNKKAKLEKVFFWTMPRRDLEVASQFWKDTKDKILNDDFERFWKLSDHKICHVRPKAKNNNDTMMAPSGRMVTKKAYWLNAEYILSVVNSHLHPSDETTASVSSPRNVSQYEYNNMIESQETGGMRTEEIEEQPVKESHDNNSPSFIKEDIARQLLTKIWYPDKIRILGLGYEDFYLLQSTDNSNDLLHWFEDNGAQLEVNLEKIGYTWCYVFEIAKPIDGNQCHPCIYMFIGKDISRITVKEFCMDAIQSAPKRVCYEFCEDSISTMDLTRFYTKIELLLKDNMFQVRDSSDQDINNYKFTYQRIRHLEDEINDGVTQSVGKTDVFIKQIVDSILGQTAAINRNTEALITLEKTLNVQNKEIMATEQTEQEVKLVNTNFQDNHGVVISGGNNDIHITIDKSGNLSATSKPKERTVPKELQTEKARTLIMKFQQAGWMDEALQPVNMSRPKMAVFAHSLANELEIKNMWTTFEDLWGVKALSSAYQEGMKQQSMSTFLSDFEKTLGS